MACHPGGSSMSRSTTRTHRPRSSPSWVARSWCRRLRFRTCCALRVRQTPLARHSGSFSRWARVQSRSLTTGPRVRARSAGTSCTLRRRQRRRHSTAACSDATGKGDADGEGYWHWKHADKDIGGMTSHMGGPDVPPHWLAYVAVSDVDATTKQAASLGGKVLVPSMDIPNVGRFSVIQDPTGAVVSPFLSARG